MLLFRFYVDYYWYWLFCIFSISKKKPVLSKIITTFPTSTVSTRTLNCVVPDGSRVAV